MSGDMWIIDVNPDGTTGGAMHLDRSREAALGGARRFAMNLGFSIRHSARNDRRASCTSEGLGWGGRFLRPAASRLISGHETESGDSPPLPERTPPA